MASAKQTKARAKFSRVRKKVLATGVKPFTKAYGKKFKELYAKEK